MQIKKVSNKKRIEAANKGIPACLTLAMVGFIVTYFGYKLGNYVFWIGISMIALFVGIAIALEINKINLQNK